MDQGSSSDIDINLSLLIVKYKTSQFEQSEKSPQILEIQK